MLVNFRENLGKEKRAFLINVNKLILSACRETVYLWNKERLCKFHYLCRRVHHWQTCLSRCLQTNAPYIKDIFYIQGETVQLSFSSVIHHTNKPFFSTVWEFLNTPALLLRILTSECCALPQFCPCTRISECVLGHVREDQSRATQHRNRHLRGAACNFLSATPCVLN